MSIIERLKKKTTKPATELPAINPPESVLVDEVSENPGYLDAAIATSIDTPDTVTSPLSLEQIEAPPRKDTPAETPQAKATTEKTGAKEKPMKTKKEKPVKEEQQAPKIYLLVDTIPIKGNTPTGLLSTLFVRTHAQILESEGALDYSLVEFGKGPGIFLDVFKSVLASAIKEAQENNNSDVYLIASTSQRETSIVLSYLETIVDVILAGRK